MAWDLAAESEPDGGGGDRSRLLRHINSKTNTKVAKGGDGEGGGGGGGGTPRRRSYPPFSSPLLPRFGKRK